MRETLPPILALCLTLTELPKLAKDRREVCPANEPELLTEKLEPRLTAPVTESLEPARTWFRREKLEPQLM